MSASLRLRLHLAMPAVGIFVFLVAGCATYTAKIADLRPELAAGDYDAALATIAEETGDKDVLLRYLESGLILHRAGRWVESNEAFAAAERTAEELYSGSLTESAVSLFTNDMQISYRARPFEMAMVPYYRALNYIELGLPEDALVEARKTSLLLSHYIDATIAGIERGDTDDLARTRNDPFMLYFSGMLYDWDGELNDAFIAYRNAATAYQDLRSLTSVEIPPSLAGDLERTSGNLGFGAELAHLRAACPAVFAASSAETDVPDSAGTVVVLLESGFVPAKNQNRLNLPIFEGETYDDDNYWAWQLAARSGDSYAVIEGYKVKYWLTVAIPELRAAPSPVRSVRLRTPDGGSVTGVRAHHPAATALITFEAEYAMILFKTILRGLSKYLATTTIEKESQFLGLLANIFSSATETADTRSWVLLPEQIQLVRVDLPAGVHDLSLDLLDGSGRTIGTVLVPQVRVRSGDWTFVGHRVFDQ